MNYSLLLKEELIADAPHRACCQAAYLRGLFVNAAQTKTGKVVLKLSALSARRECARIYRRLYKKTALVDNTTMLFSSEELLRDLTAAPVFSCKACKMAYLRGAMIAAGSATDPLKGYHLEFRVIEAEGRDLLIEILAEHGWSARCRTLKEGFGVYFKSSTVMENILSALGTNNALFALMNAKIRRGIRSEENRATNCETKNISKVVDAAGRVLAAIATIREMARFEVMPEELRETAALREENLEISLVQLAKLHNPPLTKSGLNHRLQKIIAFADTLKSEANEKL